MQKSVTIKLHKVVLTTFLNSTCRQIHMQKKKKSSSPAMEILEMFLYLTTSV